MERGSTKHGPRLDEAPDDVLAEIDRLPAGATFRTVNDAWTALGHPVENRRW